GRRIKSWEVRYDSCELAKEVQKACQRKDGRLAFDEIWDSKRAHGYGCGRRQYRFKGNSWEKICETVRNATTISEIYTAVKCAKVNTSAKTPANVTVARKIQRNSAAKKKDEKKKGPKKAAAKKPTKNAAAKKKDEKKGKKKASNKKKGAAKKKDAAKKKKEDDDDII
ncbi:hypothetical protein HDU67_002680, partial [Dinochytrium kinnereticum]